MARVNCQIYGVDELSSYLDGFDGQVKEAAKRGLKRGGQILLTRMRQNAEPHRRSGKLQAALKAKERSGAVDVGVFDNDAPHAHLVELGHGGPKPAPAYPFMEPAYVDTADEIQDIIVGEINGAIG